MISTLIESAGLFIVIAAGIFFAYSSGITVNFLEVPSNIGIAGILSATALIFFAYIGFEDVANVAEETKNAAKVVPKALVFSIAISTILYILVAVLSINTIGWQALSQHPDAGIRRALQQLNVKLPIQAQVTLDTSERMLLGTDIADEWFLPALIEQLHAAGKVPEEGECYTYVTLPVFEEGKYEVDNLNPVPAYEHFALTGDIHCEILSRPLAEKSEPDVV